MADATPCTPENCGETFTRCGTSTGYGYWKCRCVKCRESNAAKQRKQNKRSAVRPPSDPNTFTHGTLNSYRYHKCRCGLCVEAVRAHDRERYATKRGESQREYSRQYRSENREQCNATIDRWKAENREKVLRYKGLPADWQPRQVYSPDERSARRRESHKTWMANNPEYERLKGSRRRARHRSVIRVAFTVEQWDQKKSYWGNRCHLQIPGRCTGVADTMDHVKPLIAGGSHMLANLRPACLPCNASKKDKWPYAVAGGPTIRR